MSTGPTDSHSWLQWTRIAFQFGLGVALLAYGLGRVTGVISWSLPPVAYVVAGVALFVSGILLADRL